MFHRQQLQQPPSFTYLSHHHANPRPEPNPDSYLSYYQPQPVPHFAEPTLHPPGTDPYVNPGPYSLAHVGVESQNQYYEDPNVGSSSWVTGEAGSIRYEPGSLVSTSLDYLGNSYWKNQSLVNDITKSLQSQSNGIQPLRCDVCNIDCNSKDVFEKHISGKKHQRNMQNQLNPAAATLQNSYNTVNGASLPSQIGGTNRQITFGASGVAVAQELEIKRQKLLNGGAAVDSLRVCTICNVACNGEEVFNKHLLGKKHVTQAGLMSLNGVGQYFMAIKAQNNSFWSGVPKKTKVVQSAWCEVCKINCNSNDVYVKHLQGKKHKKNLENLQNSKNGTSTSVSIAASTPNIPMIGPIENPGADKTKGVNLQKSQKRAAQSQSPTEDLETKKQKVVEGGAAAGAVRVCTICNVVCNSQAVFSSHLAGQKHAAMLKKQAAAEAQTSAPKMVYAT